MTDKLISNLNFKLLHLEAPTRSSCQLPDREYLCILIVTTENVHVLVDLPLPTPHKILPESESHAGAYLVLISTPAELYITFITACITYIFLFSLSLKSQLKVTLLQDH